MDVQSREDIEYDDYVDPDEEEEEEDREDEKSEVNGKEKTATRLTQVGELKLIEKLVPHGLTSLPTGTKDLKILHSIIRHVTFLVSENLLANKSDHLDLQERKLLHALKAISDAQYTRMTYMLNHGMWARNVFNIEASRMIIDALKHLRGVASMICNTLIECEKEVDMDKSLSLDTLIATRVMDMNAKIKQAMIFVAGDKNRFVAVEQAYIEHALYLTDVCLYTNGYGITNESPVDALYGRTTSNVVKVTQSVLYFRAISSNIDQDKDVHQYLDDPAVPFLISEMLRAWAAKSGAALTRGEVEVLIRRIC